MVQMFEFIKAFILINIVWTSDKICLFISDLLALSNLHSFLLEFQILVNIFISLSIGVLTIIKIYKALKKKDKEEEKSDGEDEEN